MQQTQPSSHALMWRCSKRVQRVARTAAVRLGKRGACIVVVAALLLLLLALLAWTPTPPPQHHGTHTEAGRIAAVVDRAPPVALPSPDSWLVRPDGHGGSVRVVLFMLSTHINDLLCYALASAYFVDLPIVVLGYGGKYKSHVWRWSVYAEVVQRAGLRDSDVVMLLDTDTLFSGEDVLPFIDDYIARSPAGASALDVRAVRAGTALAPSIFETQYTCYYLQTYGMGRKCFARVQTMLRKIAAYVSRTGVKYYLPSRRDNMFANVNGGVSIHRVWSLRELVQAHDNYVATHEPTEDKSRSWWCDQSVFMLLYTELRVWEVEHDTLRNATTAATLRSQHGLRAGQLNVDHSGRMSTGLTYMRGIPLQLTDEQWRGADSGSKVVVSIYKSNMSKFADDVWRRYGSSVRMQQRTLTRSRSATHIIDVAPPFIMLPPRRIRDGDTAAVRVAPLIIHMHASDKKPRLTNTLPALPWYVPMRHDAIKWQQGREHVLSSLIELWMLTNVTKRVRYGDVCQEHHPFLTPPPPPSP